MAYTVIGGGWPEGANSTEINAVRQVIMEDMRIIEALAPDSGAYFNEVRAPPIQTMLQVLSLTLSPCGAFIGVTIRI